MKVVFLIRDLEHGGAQRQLIALSTGLRERGHRVVVAVLYGGYPLERELAAAGVPLHRLDKRGRWDVIPLLWRLGRVLRRERPEIVHGYDGAANLVALLVKPSVGAKVVWGVRGSEQGQRHHDWLARLLATLHRRLSPLADLVICNSYAGCAGAGGRNTVVVPNGIDTERFRPDVGARARVRAEFGIGDDERLVGMVGRLHPMKDHPTFLAAAALLAARREELRFMCVGTGPDVYARQLRQLAASLGLADRLIWTDARDDMPAVYNALDLLVSASAYGEGFSNVVGEAIACGIPCVVTDVGDSALVVDAVGEVVPPRDPAALGEAIGRAIDAVGRGALDPDQIRERIVTNFSPAHLLDATECALRRLVHEPAGPDDRVARPARS